MADRCSLCGPPPDLQQLEGLFTVLMCVDCLPGRTRPRQRPLSGDDQAEMRAGLDLMATWTLEQKATAFSGLLQEALPTLGWLPCGGPPWRGYGS
jgi:hypothetical protein